MYYFILSFHYHFIALIMEPKWQLECLEVVEIFLNNVLQLQRCVLDFFSQSCSCSQYVVETSLTGLCKLTSQLFGDLSKDLCYFLQHLLLKYQKHLCVASTRRNSNHHLVSYNLPVLCSICQVLCVFFGINIIMFGILIVYFLKKAFVCKCNID